MFHNKILGTLPNIPSQQLAHTDENIPVFHEFTAPYSETDVLRVISQLSSAADHLVADLCFFQFLYYICFETDLYFIIAIYCCYCDSLLLFVIIVRSIRVVLKTAWWYIILVKVQVTHTTRNSSKSVWYCMMSWYINHHISTLIWFIRLIIRYSTFSLISRI